MPGMDGYELCRILKNDKKTKNIPIIFISAYDNPKDIMEGLTLGGADYITKPFKLAVLMSKINAIIRRSRHFSQAPGELSSSGITLRLLEGRAYKDRVPLELTAAEYKLLRFLMEHPDIILSPEQIMGNLWDRDGNFVDGNTLAVYIRRLRAKIEDDPASPTRIVTVRRMGYKWSGGGRSK